MSKIVWDETGSRKFETGVDHAVLFPKADGNNDLYEKGVAWNGLTGYTESPEGAEANDFWADNIKYASLISAEQLKATIEAYTYPDEFNACNGFGVPMDGVYIGLQSRKPFGFVVRTKVGSDTDPSADNYRIHVLYNATAAPSERSYETVNDSPDAITFSWEINTTPVVVGTIDNKEYKPTSLMVFDSSVLGADKMKILEDKLYGTDSTEPMLPTPAELITLLK